MPRTSARLNHRQEPLIPVGSKVRKFFKGHGWYNGEVKSVRENGDIYKVVYEDNDVEEYHLEDLRRILVRVVDSMEEQEDNNESSSPGSSTPEEEEESDDEKDEDGYDEDDEEEEEEYSNEDDGDGDGEESILEYEEEEGDLKPKATPAKPKRAAAAVPVTPSPVKNNNKTTKARAKSLKSQRSLVSESSKDNNKKKQRTIAFRGLPRGALAQCPSGLTIRSLDGISPLVRHSSFLHHAANKPDSKLPASSPPPSSTHLPGKLLVVKLDRDGMCPKDFEGKTFDSVADFHAALSSSDSSSVKIDYDMHVVADPVFAPWDFVQARLVSSGLLDDNSSSDRRSDDSSSSADDSHHPLIHVARLEWDGQTKISGSIVWYKDYVQAKQSDTDDDLQWALIEAEQRDIPSVLVGAPLTLVQHLDTHDLESKEVTDDDDETMPDVAASGLDETILPGSDKDLVPLPTTKVAQVRLAASLLQKAIRRGNALCSHVPLIEACAALLNPRADNNKSRPGATLAMLKVVWSSMLVDASPFDDADECLGLASLLLLSLVAKADPEWSMPLSLRRAAVASALRTAQCAPSQPWLGFVERMDDWWDLEDMAEGADLANKKATLLRNILRAAQAVAIPGRLAWGKWNRFIGDASAAAVLSYLNKSWDGSYLPAAPSPPVDEIKCLTALEKGASPSISVEPRLQRLDVECRLAAIEPTVVPYTLVLLQALLSQPPTKWKKHGLPSLSRQVRKLMSEANARIRERVQLARLATWGKEKAASAAATTSATTASTKGAEGEKSVSKVLYKSFREVVTPTGTLSEQETEIIDCFEAIQEWLSGRLLQVPTLGDKEAPPTPTTIGVSTNEGSCPRFRQVKAGPPLTAFDGRIGFLLAFGSSIEVEVCPDPQSSSSKEVVSAMFCGDANEPLLVQRIGKARKEGKEAATVGGSTSGATAVPSLGYVQRNRSVEEAKLTEATETAVANYWKGGRTAPLPLPPAGLQWDLPGNANSKDIGWEDHEAYVRRTVELVQDEKGNRSWHFAIEGKRIEAFDARSIVSPCALDLDDRHHSHEKLEPGSERDRCLRLALYVKESSNGNDLPHGKAVLEAMASLHDLAGSDREKARMGLSEGRVYDWMPLACKSLIPPRTWRDALLSIRTRENDFVVLGKGIASDGTGAPRDMAEGVLVRLFHGLEMLYPQALRKEAALKFRVRPRGAAYYHLLASLEMLGRGERVVQEPGKSSTDDEKIGSKRKPPPPPPAFEDTEADLSARKRPRRSAAASASKKTAEIFAKEQGTASKAKSDKAEESYSYMSDDTDASENADEKSLPLPKIKTTLWDHQEKSVAKVVEGVRQGRRGHADASAVGAGKTLTALATIARLAQWIEETGRSRHGVLVMLPTKALIREWLLEIAAHSEGFHVIEQREDGSLFSLTYGKTHPPIDGNALIISTLDRVCNHPFIRQSAWDFVVIDECLSVQNAAAKRNPSAWRQIEVSMCGVLMLSATFFRSKYDQLFYMIRMLRSPLPRTLEWLPATIHEHIVCQVPESKRTWSMKAQMVPLPPQDLKQYRARIEAFRRKQVNEPSQVDGRKLWTDLESFLRSKYEGRDIRAAYRLSSPMSEAFAKTAQALLKKGRRPLIFADTSHEAEFLRRALNKQGLDAQTWTAASKAKERSSKLVIVAVKTVEGQGLNMQGHADAIICRPTPGDHLEQMKGRIDRPGQTRDDLLLVVMVCEHTLEEAKFANIRLVGSFFRQYIAPVATKYKERIDVEATLAAGGTQKLKSGTVSGAWKRSLEAAGQSGAFAKYHEAGSNSDSVIGPGKGSEDDDFMEGDLAVEKTLVAKPAKDKDEPKYKPLNKVIRNKGDPEAVRQAKANASGKASKAVLRWLFPPKESRNAKKKGVAKNSLLRFSDEKPAVVLTPHTVYKAVTHLSNSDPKLASLIARVGADALVSDCGTFVRPTQARLFDRCLRAITFTMVSVDAGNAFLRRFAMKVGTCLEQKTRLLNDFFKSMKEGGDNDNLQSPEHLMELLLGGKHNQLTFTYQMVRQIIDDCEIIKGKRSGYPHLCGVTFPCGKNDDHRVFLDKARAHAKGGGDPVSAGFSNSKASFIVSLVEDFENQKISAEKLEKASDREAAKMLMELKGIGDWCAGGVLMHFLKRADIMLYGDLTVRNYLNDLYNINHHDESETLLESAADFADTGPNRDLLDRLSKEKDWAPYRSVVCFLMYHLQEENLVLL